jgi:hypothetical protein
LKTNDILERDQFLESNRVIQETEADLQKPTEMSEIESYMIDARTAVLPQSGEEDLVKFEDEAKQAVSLQVHNRSSMKNLE